MCLQSIFLVCSSLWPPVFPWLHVTTHVCLLCCAVRCAAGASLVAGKLAKEDPYHMFAAATRALGFHAMLSHHRYCQLGTLPQSGQRYQCCCSTQ